MQQYYEVIRQSIRDYPKLYIVILAALVLCVFLWVIAMRRSKKRKQTMEALIEVLEHEKALRKEFKSLTQQQLIDTCPERLIEGVCCNIQLKLEKQENQNAAFDALTEPQRWIYALGYVVQDGKERLSEFFRKNGQPLTGAALEAVWELVGGEYAALFQKEYDAFDEANETVSFIKSDIEQKDLRFKAIIQELGDECYGRAKDFILANSTIFAN